jgi:hypothetical protein
MHPSNHHLRPLTPELAAAETRRANVQAYQAAFAARPHCTVSRNPLAMALKSLAVIFEQNSSGSSVVVFFDGQLLSFDCNGLKSVVTATGTAWPARYALEMAAIADELPIRLKFPDVEVGIWQTMLEIDDVRCPGVREVK